MDNIGNFLIPVMVLMLLGFVQKLNKKSEEKMDESNFVVKAPKTFFWLGIICATSFGALIVFGIFSDEIFEWWGYLTISLFVILGLYLILDYINWELKIEGNIITYTSLIGKKNSFIFDNIGKAEFKIIRQEFFVYDKNDKKIFSVHNTSNGYNVFISRLRKERIPLNEPPLDPL